MRDASTATTTTETTTALEAFLEATTEALASLGADKATLATLEAAGDELIETVTTQHDRLEELETRVETLEAELTAERETRAKEAAEDRKRLHDLETQLDENSSETDGPAESDHSGEVDTPSSPSTPQVQPPETPLEDVLRIPEHLVEGNLTANQRRARFVAKDIHEYTQRVPAGRAIKSSALRRVLTAGEDARIYTETVSRVIDFLDELGGGAVKVRESKQGERVIVFTEAFVERVRTYQRHAAGNSVVTDAEVAR
jgi:DNA repair exonuclease SbcCD ATPase subunit